MPPKRVLSPSSARRTSIVAAAGGDFSTIAAAITFAAAQNPTAANRWTLLIMPGVYTETLTLQNYVDLVGVGPAEAVTCNGQIIATAACRVQNLSFNQTGLASPIITHNANVTFEMDTCRADVAAATVEIVHLTGSGTLVLRGCQFKGMDNVLVQAGGSLLAEGCSFEVAAGGADYPLEVEAGTLFEFRGCLFTGGGSSGEATMHNASLSTSRFLHCIFRKGAAATYSLSTSVTPSITVAGCLANAAQNPAITAADLVVNAGV